MSEAVGSHGTRRDRITRRLLKLARPGSLDGSALASALERLAPDMLVTLARVGAQDVHRTCAWELAGLAVRIEDDGTIVFPPRRRTHCLVLLQCLNTEADDCVAAIEEVAARSLAALAAIADLPPQESRAGRTACRRASRPRP